MGTSAKLNKDNIHASGILGHIKNAIYDVGK